MTKVAKNRSEHQTLSQSYNGCKARRAGYDLSCCRSCALQRRGRNGVSIASYLRPAASGAPALSKCYLG